MYCICFNGPPRSGKDSIANFIHDTFGLTVLSAIRKSLATPLRQRVFALMGIQYNADIPLLHSHYEEIKDQPQEIFGGRTVREMMIHDSEEVIKPLLGQDAFAKILLSGLGTSIHLPGLCLISDSGFQVETDTLAEAFGPDNLLVVQTSRKGKSFEGDSRSWVYAPNMLKLRNDSTIEKAADSVMEFCDKLGWDI